MPPFVFPLITMANALSLIYAFKNQIFLLLSFAIATPVSFSLISTLIFMIPFILLTLGYFFVCFPLGVKVGCLFDVPLLP